MSKLVSKFGEISKKVATIPTNLNKLVSLILNVVAVDKLLSKGRYRILPDNKWSTSVNNVVSRFSTMINDVNKRLSLTSMKFGIYKIETVISSVVKISKLISSGIYRNVPGNFWIAAVRSVVDRMAALSVLIDKKYNFLSLKTGLTKVKMIAETISHVSKSLASGKYGIFPSVEWGKGAYLSLQGFLNLKVPGSSLVDMLFGKSGGIDKKKLAGVLDLIMMVDSTFSKGKFRNFPTMAWSDGVIKTLSKFSTILSLVDFSKFDKKFGKNVGLTRMISDIGLLARTFDKLAQSLQRISNSIGLIDQGKIESIRALTSNVVLLSLMDASQFDRMMQKLEQNAQLFGSLLSDSKVSGSSPSSSGARMTGVDSKSMTSVKSPGSSPTKGPSPGELEQGKMMKQLVEIMADIASVAGSRGALVEYIKNKDSMKSGFNWAQDESSGSGFLSGLGF